MPFSSTESESLHRQIRFLSGEVARVERERDKRLNDKDLVIIKKHSWNERTQKAFAKLKVEHGQLKETARILREEAQANGHRTNQLQNELKVLYAETDAAKRRIKEARRTSRRSPSPPTRSSIRSAGSPALR